MLNPLRESPKLVFKYKYSWLPVDIIVRGFCSVVPVSLPTGGLFGESPSLISI